MAANNMPTDAGLSDRLYGNSESNNKMPGLGLQASVPLTSDHKAAEGVGCGLRARAEADRWGLVRE